ncbi:DUF748 domain-containing protein [Methylomagnum sp.]
MRRLIKWATNRWLLTLTAVLLIYTLIGFSLVPFLVQHYTPRLAADWLKRRASVSEVQFNPYSFTVEIRDLAFDEADGQPLLALKRLFLDFEPSQFLASRTLALADLQLDGPSASLVLDPVGKLNLAKIAASLPQSEEPTPPPADEPPPRFVLGRFTLTDGAVKFTDLGKSPPINETVEHLDLELKGISTLPDRQGAYQIEAALPDGGKLAWRGDVSLSPVASSGELKIEALRLATLWNFIKDRLNLAEPGGVLDLSAQYQLSYAKDKTALSVSHGVFKLSGLRLISAQAKEPLLALEEIGFDQASFDLSGQTIRVPVLTIRKGTVNASVDESGQVDWLTLLKPESVGKTPQPTPPAPEPPAPGQPWKVALEKFEIAELSLNYADASHKSPFAVSVGDFGLSFGAEAEAGADVPKARVDQLALHLNQATLTQPGKSAPLFGWDSFAVAGGRLDLEKREAAIKSADLKGGGTAIVREADGTLRPLDIFAPKGAAKSAPTSDTHPNAPEPSENKPWRFALDQFSLQGFGVALTDRSLAPELAYHVDDIRATVNHVSNDGKTPVTFDAQLKARQGGALQASGTASPTGDSAQAKIKIDRLNLTPLQPVISQFAALKLDSANASTDLNVNFRQGESSPSVQATGGASLNKLSLKQSKDGKRFLAWKSLAVNGLRFGLAPDGLSIKEVRIVEPDTIIAIAKDHSTNLAAVFKPQKPEPRPAKPPARPDKSKPAATQPFPVSVERVRIDDGQIDFSDMSLVLPFATHIHDFDGAATGISMTPKSRTTLKFTGRVDEYGEVKVDGSLNPLQIKAFSDINVVFRNVAMSSLSPYSATFAGHRIESGKLNLDLTYKIDNSRLKSQNKIVLDQFTLGEKVESPDALDLPLDLAIALLTDSEGKIQAAVPIEGDIDNPQFDYGTVVWDAVVNLVKKVVTAPFNAIAAAFGGSDEKLDAVLFEPAKDAIPPPEREKLHKVAEALAQRPKLRLTVHGGFNPTLDGAALQSLEVRRDLARQMNVALSPGEESDAVSFGDAATQRALEKLASKRGGGIAEAAQADYQKETGRPPARIGAVAGLVGRASDTPEFYEKLFNKLVETAPLPPDQLEALAQRRGLAVITELADKQHLDKARIAVGKIEATEDSPEGKVPVKLELMAE